MRHSIIALCITLSACSQPTSTHTTPTPSIDKTAIEVDRSSSELVQVERTLNEIAASGESEAPDLKQWSAVRGQGGIVGIHAVMLAQIAAKLREQHEAVTVVARERDAAAASLQREQEAREKDQAQWHRERDELQARIKQMDDDRRSRAFLAMIGFGCVALAVGISMFFWAPKLALPTIAFGLIMIGAGRFLDKFAWIIDIAVGVGITGLVVWLCYVIVHKQRNTLQLNKQRADYKFAVSQLVREFEKFVKPLMSPEQWIELLRDLRAHQTETTKAIVDELRTTQ